MKKPPPKSKTKQAAARAAARLSDDSPRLAPPRPEDLLSTGCTLLNLAFTGRPGGGVPKGAYLFFVGDSSSGKAQPLDAKVLTPSGWSRMGDLRVGDAVIDPDGGTAFVTGVFPQGRKEVFRVGTSDGAFTECCGDHLWLTQTSKQRVLGSSSVKDTRQVCKELESGAVNYLPFPRPVEFPRRSELPLHPYVLGVLLGDGCFTNTQVSFSSTDEDIVDRVRELLPPGCVVRPITGCDYVITRTARAADPAERCRWTLIAETTRRGYAVYRCRCGTVSELSKGSVAAGTSKSCGCLEKNPVLEAIRSLGLSVHRSYDKFIPEMYLRSSVDDRLELLRGLMDTDGTTGGGNCSFSTTSPRLRDGIIELVRSLGGRVGVPSSKIPTYSYKGVKRNGRVSYGFVVRLPDGMSPFYLPRKTEKYKPVRTVLTRRVVSVRPLGEKDCQCISVSSARSLYVTDDYLVTHNTWFCFNLLAEAARNPHFDGYRFVFDNAENGALFDVKQFFGQALLDRLEPPAPAAPGSETVEQFYYHLDRNCAAGPCVYVLDSMDALIPQVEEDRFDAEVHRYETGKGEVPGSMGMAKAKLNNNNINRVVKALRKNGSILIVIALTKDKVGSHIPGLKTRSGGRALRSFAHLEAWTSTRGVITNRYHGKDREVGQYIQVDVQKNRVCGWEGKMPLIAFLKGYGVDDVGSNIDYLLDERHWQKIRKPRAPGERPARDDEDEKETARFAAPEFAFEGTREQLVKQIQDTDSEWELSKLVAQVWRDVRDNALPARKPRYT